MTKKLYEVHVEFTYYAMADNFRDAELLADDAFRDEDPYAIASATEMTKANVHIEWPGNSLVYGADRDTTLDEALGAIGLPSVSEIRSELVNRIRQAANAVNNRESSAQLHPLVGRIREYLSNGGLFNPEMMDHDKVRELLMDVLQHLTTKDKP